jgi:hypothetical protein
MSKPQKKASTGARVLAIFMLLAITISILASIFAYMIG